MNEVTYDDALALARAFASDTEGAALMVHNMTRVELAQTVGRLAVLLRIAVDDDLESLTALVDGLEHARTETGAREDNGR